MAAEAFTPEKRFLAAAKDGRNCFLTGMAGTGKSTLLKQFISESPRRVDVTAPTGVAALNVGGMTIHRFCGMMLGPQPGQSNEDYFVALQRDTRRSIQAGFSRVRRCEALVIDEISMLPGRQLDFVEFLFRRLRGRDEPFGGCQIIATGDFLQLPPVRTSDTEPHDWAFQAPAWNEAEFKTLNLETVRRQDEPLFVRALGQFRLGHVWGDTARLLQSRVRNFPPANLTRLYTHNVQVDKWNDFQLADLPGDESVLEAAQSGPEVQRAFLVKNLLTPATLRLKPGALVSFTVNKNEPGHTAPLFVNGQLMNAARPAVQLGSRCPRWTDTAFASRILPPLIRITPLAPMSTQEIKTCVSITGGDDDIVGLNVTHPVFVNTLSVQQSCEVKRLAVLQEALAYAGTINLDFNGFGGKRIALTGNVSFTSGAFGFGKQMIVRIVCDTTLRTFVWPAVWKWVGAAAPANIAANKTGLLQLWCFGTSESDVVARWLVEP